MSHYAWCGREKASFARRLDGGSEKEMTRWELADASYFLYDGWLACGRQTGAQNVEKHEAAECAILGVKQKRRSELPRGFDGDSRGKTPRCRIADVSYFVCSGCLAYRRQTSELNAKSQSCRIVGHYA